MRVMLVMFVLAGCNKNEIQSEIYKGQDLAIGVVGEIPEVREKNIDFEALSLKEISANTKEVSDKFDSVFIMPEQFAEADDDQYVATYKALKIPTFFFESKKAHLPFVHEDVTYETAPNMEETAYAVGYLYSGEEEEYKDDVWRYFLYNGVKNKVNIQDVYTNIFKTIEEVAPISQPKY
ncbi:hypothetical protein [Bacillus sp. REN10]|uniref:hypothetical protein n=1 Tax=Bacillus sp. REN10 TaxID=2782541 RepID=UPI00193B1FED|nr:hypothetical protein [Bacillus sp. REN10]